MGQLPEIPGLYENVRTVSGLQIGGDINSVCAAYGGHIYNPAWIEQCCSQGDPNGYDMTYAMNLDINAPTTGDMYYRVSSFADIAGMSSYEPTTWMWVYGNVYFNGALNAFSFYDYMSTKGMNDLASLPETYTLGTGYQSMTSIYPVLNSESKEHYIGYVLVSARNEAGGAVNGVSLDQYKQSYYTNYPYITGAAIFYKYKANLADNTTGVRVPLSLVGFVKNVEIYTGANINYMYPRYKITGKQIQVLGEWLISLNNISSAVKSDSGGQFYSIAISSHSIYPFKCANLFTKQVTPGFQPFLYTTIDEVERAANSRGLWWADSEAEIANAHGIDTVSGKIHAPIINTDGSTTGDSYSGTAIKPHWEDLNIRPIGDTSIVHVEGVNPNPKPDDTDEYDKLVDPTRNEDLELGNASYNGIGSFATYYVLNHTSVLHLNDELWNGEESIIDQIAQSLRLWGNNPIEAVMSFRLYPFDVGTVTGATSSALEPLKFGRVEMQTRVHKIPPNSSVILDLGETWINTKNLGLPKNFRALPPYTDASVYIPFVGIIPISLSNFMDNVMRIRMVVDVTTGTCTACIYAGSVPLMYVPGAIGVDIPLSQSTIMGTSHTVMSTIMNGIADTASNTVSLGIGAVTENIAKTKHQLSFDSTGESETLKEFKDSSKEVVNEVKSNIGNLATNLLVDRSDMQSKGASSPCSCLSQPLYCYLILASNEEITPANFGHTYGHACHFSSPLSQVSGYTICANPDTSGIRCTLHEQEMIKNMLESGVYL